ncbi:heterokaryon incompatibility protein-domain-containing protein, partial [Epithele typhae]|uniref:heterokaryon incompatibility protein-domain-containing protein n=1 Tax=Epithele typhae TaxID=378194 RepID=UPI00200748BA
MWLLDTTFLELHQVSDPTQERYAILSHVWNLGKEDSFHSIRQLHNNIARESPAHAEAYLAHHHKVTPKLRSLCKFARHNGYRRVWIDTCCIDQSSSAELSEAINSMYKWYLQAAICYAFLADVDDDQDPSSPASPLRTSFRESIWFTRGWTLQELVAPRNVVFLSRHWTVLGTKTSLQDVIAEVTHISKAVLTHSAPLHSVSVAQRMSWAAGRRTTREEDRAYSLLGIFGIHLPTIYGEGEQAFVRLQEEILRRIPDQTLFAW